MLFFFSMFACFSILRWLWRMSNRFNYGLLLKCSFVFLFLLQIVAIPCYFCDQIYTTKLCGYIVHTFLHRDGSLYGKLFQDTDFSYITLVYACFLSLFAMGVKVGIRNVSVSTPSFDFCQDYQKHHLTYRIIILFFVVLLTLYLFFNWYYNGILPFKQFIMTFDYFRERHTPLIFYISIVIGVLRTFSFALLCLILFERKILCKFSIIVFTIVCFAIPWKLNTLLNLSILSIEMLFIFYRRRFENFLYIFGFSFLVFLYCDNRALARILDTPFADYLAITYYKDKPQNLRFVKAFVQKGKDRGSITFAEHWYHTLNPRLSHHSTGVGCIAASWVNFNWWGGGILFIFGYIVGCLEVFFATRKKFLIYWHSVYILLGFQIGNIFVISFLSSFVKGGIAVTCILFVLGLFLERFSRNETN